MAFCAIALPADALAQAARVLSVQGSVMLERAGGPPRILGVGDELGEKDVINVAQASHAMLEFRDRTRITLRPNTVFRVDAYAESAPQGMVLGLVKGGFRAVSGDIAKRDPSAMRIQTNTAILGVRGTEFDARLCGSDCASDERAKPARRTEPPAAARVIDMQGTVAAGAASALRQLVPGAALYERDNIATGPDSHALIAFRDGSLVTLAGDTVVGIEQFRYAEARPGENAAVLRLSQGGLRVLTGLIAKGNPDAYRVDTAIGRVEVRGTGFDAACGGACAEAATAARDAVARLRAEAARLAAAAKAQAEIKHEAGRKVPAPPVDGLIVHAWEGRVVLGTAAGRVEVKETDTASIASLGAAPASRPAAPSPILDGRVPRPDTVRIDPSIFAPSTPAYEAGLYVWVRDGAIRLDQTATRLSGAWRFMRTAIIPTCPQTLDVSAGNAAVATQGCLAMLDAVPGFMRFDTTPRPDAARLLNMLPTFRRPDGSAGMCIAN